jgi:hypothetical protein
MNSAPIKQIVSKGNDGEGPTADCYRRLLIPILSGLQVLSEQCGWEGDNCHAEQEQSIDHQQRIVGAHNEPKHVVMRDLHHQDGEEAREVREIGGPIARGAYQRESRATRWVRAP